MNKIYTCSEISMLEKANSYLYMALSSQNNNDMRQAIGYVMVNLPFVIDSAYNNTVQIMKEKGIHTIKEVYFVADVEEKNLADNTLGYLLAVNSILERIYPKTFSQESILSIYYPQLPLRATDLIYESRNGQLKVVDLLSIAGYVIKIANAIAPDQRNEQASAAITVFKGIELALNNQRQDKPLNKMLHLANDFLTSVVKSNIKRDEEKRSMTITSAMVDVLIDFLIRK